MIKFKSSTTYVLTIAVVILLPNINNAHRNALNLNLGNIVKSFLIPILNPQTEDPENNEINTQDSEVDDKKEEEKRLRLRLMKLDEDADEENQQKEYSDADDTIILEEIPNIANKISHLNTTVTDNSLVKYKQLQHKIGGLLKEEQISNTTKNVITEVFDKLMSRMNKCFWNSRSRDLTNTSPRFRKSDIATRLALLELWRQKFNKLINRFYKQREDSNDMSGSKEILELLASIREFFFEMHNDFQKLVTRYDLVCKLVDEKNDLRSPKKYSIVKNTNSLDVNDDVTHQKSRPDKCEFYIICAHELQEFSKDFYADLEETVEQVFNNYLHMYLADEAKESSNHKSLFKDFIKHVNRHMKKRFNATLHKEFNTMDLDSESDTKVTVEDVKKIIENTVINIKVLIEEALTKKISALPDQIRFTVKQDIMTNADIELGNVQETFKDKICSTFQTCHGKYVRRMGNSTKPGDP